MGRTLLDKIEEGALDPKADLPSLLRQCVALGGRTGSEELRAWARQELNGYGQDDEVPEYRVLPASLHVDGANMRFRITGEQISPMALPDFARDDVKEEQVMTTSIGEIAHLVEHLTAQHEFSAKLSFAGASDLAQFMTMQQGGNPRVERVYKQVSVTSLAGVLDAVRTKLVELTAEIRAAGDGAVLSSETVDQAVNVVVHGKKSTVVVNQASGQDIEQQAGGKAATRGKEREHWTRSWGFWITVLATVVSSVVAVYLLWVR